MKKTLLHTILILNLICFSSCKTHYSKTELNANFTNEQIADLNKITDFFKTETCGNINFEKCYKQTNHDSLQAEGKGFWTKIDFEKQKELYQNISQSTFDEIWMFSNATFYPSGTKRKSLSAVSTGKYQKFLTDFGKKNPRIAKYAKRIEASGDFGGFDFNYREIIKDNKSFKLKDPNIQLILAIHYLSMNDQSMRNADLMKRKIPKFK
ncbi:hypothetical protein [Mesonia aestuariivivens]|uniref:Lipoprotein n=1 Tax=Mesonia aestuariivivens TaxID=2796128 RepID=A0ABS6W4X5_9FLAO|nr:hypothetical protein [Mesonia aestuariivivens]MBW2962907.1 hypothetical protein [Mesonia aestuariivivens]